MSWDICNHFIAATIKAFLTLSFFDFQLPCRNFYMRGQKHMGLTHFFVLSCETRISGQDFFPPHQTVEDHLTHNVHCWGGTFTSQSLYRSRHSHTKVCQVLHTFLGYTHRLSIVQVDCTLATVEKKTKNKNKTKNRDYTDLFPVFHVLWTVAQPSGIDSRVTWPQFSGG